MTSSGETTREDPRTETTDDTEAEMSPKTIRGGHPALAMILRLFGLYGPARQ
jgi:hypothetical protein